MKGKNKNEKYNNIKKKKIETTLEELCKDVPSEFYDFMTYCRKRKNLDAKVKDFTWKQNAFSRDKEALKNSMLNVIKKKPINYML
jgi:hypothetical protein